MSDLHGLPDRRTCVPKAWRRVHRGPAPIEIFFSRTRELARMWAGGHVDISAAIGSLEDYAHETGLLRELGRDVIEAMIVTAFANARRRQ